MTSNIKHKFIIGDEWLYYKIYCGAFSSNDILRQITVLLYQQNIVDYWFFIRYSDPDFHLRLRLHISDQKKIGDVIALVNELFSPKIKDHLIYKIECATYIREIERYGASLIEDTEKLFYHDSKTCVEALNTTSDATSLLLFTLKTIDFYLTQFDFTIDQKLLFVTNHRDSFKEEFQINRKENNKFSKKYDTLEPLIRSFLNGEEHYDLDKKTMTAREKSIVDIYNKIMAVNQKSMNNLVIENLLASYIHMSINRMFSGKQRLYELLCYHLMTNYYNTVKYNVHTN